MVAELAQTPVSIPRRPTAGGTSRSAWLALAACLLAAVVYFQATTPHVGAAAFAVAGVTCTVATIAGIVRYRPTARHAWCAIVAASVAFLAGAALRVPGEQFRLAHLVPDLFSLAGYVLFVYAAAGWLRARRGRQDWSSLTDALIVGLGAALAAWAMFVVPALELPGVPAVHRALFATYPVLDVVLLALLLQMVFTQSRRNTAFGLFMLGMVWFFLGDVAYIARDSGVFVVDRPLIDLPYFFAFGTVAAAALHPSMRTLAERATGERSARWDGARTVVIAFSLLTVALVPIAAHSHAAVDVAGRVVLSVALIVAVVTRSQIAINRLADREATARRQARHDALTSLPNRSALIDRLESRSHQAAAPVSVLFLDLDGFKLVNDSYGHDVGDQLLILVAERLRHQVRTEEDMVARLGGDEFVVVTQLVGDDAVAVADRILAALAQPFSVSTGEIFVATSIGIASHEEVGAPVDGEALVRDADIAMYEAKLNGRGQVVCFDMSLREKVQRRISTEMSLRFAVERGEFELHYQPLVGLADDAVLGYEALLRWNHPQRGQVSPLEFVPVAEETGLIVPIGAWAIRTATRDAARWRAMGHAVHISINVSARQLRDGALVDTVTHALADAALPPHALWLELTETGLVEDPDAALETLRALNALGVTIAIDDFGTGYSSLGYLKRFPVSAVKIDREFVRDLSSGGDDDAIVRAVVAMASALRMTVVAEGVERREQAEILAALGCGMAQGWLYGRPAPAEALRFPAAQAKPVIRSGTQSAQPV